MSPRTVALLLLSALALSQWVSLVRCAGGCRAGGREPRPHVHLDTPFAGSPAKPTGCRHHHDCPAHHRRAPAPAQADASADTAPSSESPTRSDEREGGVVYLSFDPWLVVRTPSVSGGFRDAHDLPLAVHQTGEPAATRCGDTSDFLAHPPPRPDPSRPLYQLNSALLI